MNFVFSLKTSTFPTSDAADASQESLSKQCSIIGCSRIKNTNIRKQLYSQQGTNQSSCLPATIMRHLIATRMDTETTGEDGNKRTLKPITEICSALSSKSSVTNDEKQMHSVPLTRCHRSVFPNTNKQDWQEDSLVVPPKRNLACDDEFLNDTLEEPLGMMSMDEPEQDKKYFDLMNVNITLYGIGGILCEEKETKKSGTKVGKQRRSILKAKGGEYAEAAECAEETVEHCIPITVAASIKRNAISSQTVIETFLPSQPLNIETAPGKTTKLSATWQTPKSTLLNSEIEHDENDKPEDRRSSFEVLRMMMKTPYSREQAPGMVENYTHEHLQIGIHLCRGKELMRLGVATLIVTGDEEGQVMMHIRTKQCAEPGIQERKCGSKPRSKVVNSKNKRKKARMHFKNDNRIFRLDENASIFVGVQVLPQHDVKAAECFQDIELTDSQLLRNAHAAKACMLEMRGNERFEQLRLKKESPRCQTVANSTLLSSKSEKRLNDTVKSPQDISEDMMTGIFCGALSGMLANKSASPLIPKSSPKSSEGVKPSKKSPVLKTDDIITEDSYDDSLDSSLDENDTVPMQEIVNVKYAPRYAKSFFSAVTFADSQNDEENDDEDDDMTALTQTVLKSLRYQSLYEA